MLKKILMAVLIIFVLIQFIRPEKNEAGNVLQANAIQNEFSVPSEIENIFEISCNNCHSNHTNYPWYSNIQPVAWWLDSHIKDGKKDFNMDEFLSYDQKKQDHKMEEVIEMIENKEMPLNSYTWLHREADITDEQRAALISWAKDVRRQINYKPFTAINNPLYK
jgi:hypothetical protein